MQKKTDKELAEIKDRINDKFEGQGTSISEIQETEDGRLQATFNIDSRKFDQHIAITKDQTTKLVNRIQAEPGSILDRLRNNDELEALHQRLELGYYKDLEKAAKSGNPKEVSRVDIKFRDQLRGTNIDLRDVDPSDASAIKLYDRSEKEYLRMGMYGSTLDVLTNLSTMGFYNETTDPEVKEFFDSWVKDTDFLTTVKKIFHTLYKYSVCYVMNAKGSYEPHAEGISSIPGKLPGANPSGTKASVAFIFHQFIRQVTGEEMSLDKFSDIYNKEFSAKSGKLPISFSILDPKHVDLLATGFFDGYTVTLKPGGMKQLKEVLEELKDKEVPLSAGTKGALSLIPSGLKSAAEKGDPYTFKDEEVSVLFIRKDDYQKLPKPKGSRAFDSFDYKDELKKADFATIDGIYNYILKVTVGDKDCPVTDFSVIESLAEAFNTPQKAFSVVWNHTLNIERISASDIDKILGKKKYEPVDEDIQAALSMARALIDGTDINRDAAVLVTKALNSEVHAARSQVEKWIYQQYKIIAASVGFTTYPVVKWRTSVINTDSDAVTRASFMQMLDRKAVSIQTYMRENDLDFDTELSRMRDELPLVLEGVLQSGAPNQQSVQKPSGDQGRPKGQPTENKEKVNEQQVTKRKTTVNSPSQQSSEEEDYSLDSLIDSLKGFDDNIRKKIIDNLTGVVDSSDIDPTIDLDKEIASDLNLVKTDEGVSPKSLFRKIKEGRDLANKPKSTMKDLLED